MEFSGFAYCAENKNLNFASFMSSGTLMHQTSNMGIQHSNKMPFVELTGHKLQEPIVNSSFEINNITRSFSIAGNIHSFTANAKHFVRADNILTRKDLYGNQFPVFSFSQLVGGFVGSKSQIGSSSKESCQMWDIIFKKLAEFYDTHHHPQNCYNFEREFSQDILKTICKKEGPSCVPIGSSVTVASDKTLPIKPEVSQNTSDCSHQSSDVSKQSYAEVARIFATIQENKRNTGTSTASSTMPQRRNTSNRRNFVKCEISRTVPNNWRKQCSPQMKNYRNHFRFFSGSQRRPDNNKNYKSKNFEKEQKTDKKEKHTCSSETQRVDIKNNIKASPNSVQITPEISTHHGWHKAASETSIGASNKTIQIGQTSPIRMRFMSECSTDSEDSFVEFVSEADSDSVVKAVMNSSVSDSDLSEDVGSYQFSDDGDLDDDMDCVDGDDTETVTELSELNERWAVENSSYPASKKNPLKVHFASEDTLETVHPLIAWNYAYRAARSGPWEQMARDRERFKNRIKQVEPELAKILSPEHRCCVWKERISSMPTET